MAWTNSGNIRGPVGATGATGAQGPTGPTGATGATGAAGTTTWSGITDKPAVIAAGSDAAAARSAISAASLDGNGKVPVSELPNSIMEYQGTWNASTNTPTLANGTGSAGDVYRVSTGATRNLGAGNITFDVGDYAIYNGSTWEKADTTDAVSTVAGRTGDVTLTVADIGGNTTTALGVGSIELGHATDTTLSRSSAGVLAVEGVTVPLNSTTNTHTAQQIELGHSTDTTVSRVSAGRIAVEGVNVVTTSSTDTLSNKTISGASNTISAIPTSALSLNGSASAYVSTLESTASTSSTDLTTTTDSVTVTIGGSGLALVSISAIGYSSTSGGNADMSFAASGSNSVTAFSSGYWIRFGGSAFSLGFSGTYLLTGLSTGSTTFKAKYRAQNGGTANFLERRISVIPL